MNFSFSVISGLSISLAAFAGAWRLGSVHPAFRPFIYCAWLALVSEIVSMIMVSVFHNNAVSSNIYVLLESLLLTWQFRQWAVFGANRWLFPGLLAAMLLVWVTENFVLSSITRFSSWFRIFYSFVLVLLSISLINRQIVRERGNLLKNPVVLICLAFIIYFTYRVLLETCWVYGINENAMFRNKVYIILNYINLFSNLIYALAVLWMPTKQRFTLPY